MFKMLRGCFNKSLFIFQLLILGAPAHGYSDCWTAYFDPGLATIAFDDVGARYVSGLPAGTTCGCSIDTTTVWISGTSRSGTTSALLAARLSSVEVRMLLQQQNNDSYCRGEIIEMKPD